MELELVLAVVGDRHYSDYKTFSKVLKDELERFPATRIVTGDASGTDTMALTFCETNGIPVKVYCASRVAYAALIRREVDAELAADWERDGKAAGPIRNTKLMYDANRVLLFDGGGPGSKSIKKLAHQQGKDLELWEIVPYSGIKVAGTQVERRLF